MLVAEKRLDLTPEQKAEVIKNRKPPQSYQFPGTEYRDKRCTSGTMKRRCRHEWLSKFPFLAYSKSQDGLYCVSCVLFPVAAKQGSCAKLLLTEPYRKWKDAMQDCRDHSNLEYHKNSFARMKAFQETFANPSHRVDHSITTQMSKVVESNRTFLSSVLRAIEYLGRQGLALRGNADDGDLLNDDGIINKGNFRELLSLMCVTDEHLRTHLEKSLRNATYISKTTQNKLLGCIGDFIRDEIVREVKEQESGPFYGISADEVTDCANWEQLGIVIRYIKRNRPVERLMEYVKCDDIKGATIAGHIIDAITDAGLSTEYCRAQTYDGAGNMAGNQRGAAACFREKTGNENAIYVHCSSHELNLALSKASRVPEVYNMVCLLQSLGIYFIKSPKRQGHFERELEKAVPEQFATMKKKIKPLCETRWVERHTAFEDLQGLYQYLVPFLQKLSENADRIWDPKSVTEASGLHRQLTESKFFISFQVCRHLFGYTKALSQQLQGSDMEICRSYEKVTVIKDELHSIRDKAEVEFAVLFQQAKDMAAKVGVEINMPRTAGRQTLRSNVEASSIEEYWRRTIFVPFIDCLVSQLEERFQGRNTSAVKAVKLLPKNLEKLMPEDENAILSHYGDDLPSKSSFAQEVRLWKRHWLQVEPKPKKATETLERMASDEIEKMFPNILVIFRILLTIPATSATVERANSALRYVKNVYRNSMGESRLNALILMYLHRDIKLDYNRIIDKFATRSPRRMRFINPLGDK